MFLVVEMEVIPKPECYDSVPPCLCQKCQRYDMYMASCVLRTFGESTCGLAIVSAARSSFADVHSRSVRRKPARSRPRSRAVAPPVTTSPVAVCSSTVSACSVVSSSAPFGCLARSSAVAPSNLAVSSVVSSPVAVRAVVSSSSFVGAPSSVPSSVVVSRPASSGSIARPVSSSVVGSRPASSGSLACFCFACSSQSCGCSSSPFQSCVACTCGYHACLASFCASCQLVVPGSSVLPFGRSVGFPFVPVVCFVLAVVPVFLSSPFGFVWSFLPIWR